MHLGKPSDDEGTGRRGYSIPPVISMWRLHLNVNNERRRQQYRSAVFYAVSLVMLLFLVFRFPTSTHNLMHREVLNSEILGESIYPGAMVSRTSEWAAMENMVDQLLRKNSSSPYTLIGAIQLRTVRVDRLCDNEDDVSDACGLVPSGTSKLGANSVGNASNFKCCYPDWDTHSESTTSFGRHYEYSSGLGENGERTTSVLLGSNVFIDSSTARRTVYGTGGFLVSLPSDFALAKSEMRALRFDFVDDGTRALAISFNLLSPDTHTILLAKITFAHDSSGHIDVFPRIKVVRLMLTYFYTSTSFESAILLLWVGCVLLTLMREARELLERPSLYLAGGWNLVELIYVALALAMICFQRTLIIESGRMVTRLEGATAYEDMFVLSDVVEHLDGTRAVLMFVAVIQFYRHSRVSPRLYFLWGVIGDAIFELLHFLLMAFILLMAFALSGTFLFGSVTRHFHNMPAAVLTLLKMVLGSLEMADVNLLLATNRWLAPLYLIAFLLFGILIFMVRAHTRAKY